MGSVVFPISREAACCGVYVYLEANMVGLRNREDIRRDYIRSYEDAYIKSFEKRKSCIMQKKTGEFKVPSLKSVSYTDIENDIGYELFSRWVMPVNHIRIDIDSNYEFGALDPIEDVVSTKEPECMVSSRTDLFSIHVTMGIEEEAVSKDIEESTDKDYISPSDEDIEWVESGTELFSIICEVSKVKEDSSIVIEEGIVDKVEESTNDSNSDSSEQNVRRDIWGEIITDTPIQDVEEVHTIDERIQLGTEKVHQEVSTPVVRESKSPQKRVSTVKSTVSMPTRLDENSIRDFIKGHKLCSEVDILKHFSDHDPIKVRGVIKSAARHYKIFEKHGKFTV